MSWDHNLPRWQQQFGLDRLGWMPAEDLTEEYERHRELIRLGWASPVSEERLRRRYFLREGWPLVRSVLVAAENYLADESVDRGTPEEPRGTIVRYTWRNYYRDLHGRLRRLGRALKKEIGPGTDYRISVNAFLPEKALAVRAGVGSLGKNGVLLTREYGSWVVLGVLILNREIGSRTPPVGDLCGDCRACLIACPTGALPEPGRLLRSRCLQELTNLAIWPDGIEEIWGRRLYGCSTCQDVCPRNRGTPFRKELPPHGVVGPTLPLKPILSRDEAWFRKEYAGNQLTASWISFPAIQRNARMALKRA